MKPLSLNQVLAWLQSVKDAADLDAVIAAARARHDDLTHADPHKAGVRTKDVYQPFGDPRLDP
jgi:hypothetical protein